MDAVALALMVVLPLRQPLSGAQAERLAILLAVALAWGAVTRRNERLRRYVSADQPGPQSMPLLVWTFAALIAAPSGWAVLFVAALYIPQLVYAVRDATYPPHTLVFNAASAIVAEAVAGQLTDQVLGRTDIASLLIDAAAAAAFTLVNLVIALAALWLRSDRRSVPPLPGADAIATNLACLALGLLTGLVLLGEPAATAITVAPVALLQRGTLVTALHHASRTDTKTGILNAGAWRRHAQSVLRRAHHHGDPVAVLLVDVDGFGTVNTRWGHLIGDAALRGVASAIRATIRDDDGAGRFGGDEFAIVLAGVDAGEAAEVGERVRVAAARSMSERMHGALVERERQHSGAPAGLRPVVTVSIGVAHHDSVSASITLDELLHRADTALYDAKHAGRDRVALA